jgi:peroxiredoxin
VGIQRQVNQTYKEKDSHDQEISLKNRKVKDVVLQVVPSISTVFVPNF